MFQNGEMSFSQWRARQSQLNVPPQLPEHWFLFRGFIAFKISENKYLIHFNNRATTYYGFAQTFFEGAPIFLPEESLPEESLCRFFEGAPVFLPEENLG